MAMTKPDQEQQHHSRHHWQSHTYTHQNDSHKLDDEPLIFTFSRVFRYRYDSCKVEEWRQTQCAEENDCWNEVQHYYLSVLAADAVVEHETVAVMLNHTSLANEAVTGFVWFLYLAVSTDLNVVFVRNFSQQLKEVLVGLFFMQ